jgi:hypothetical protein
MWWRRSICHYAFYRLRDTVILDSACDIHVCNNRDRLIDLTKPRANDYLIAGDTTVPIMGLSPVKTGLSENGHFQDNNYTGRVLACHSP